MPGLGQELGRARFCQMIFARSILLQLVALLVLSGGDMDLSDDDLGPRGVVPANNDTNDLWSCDSDMNERGLPTHSPFQGDEVSESSDLGPQGLIAALPKRRGRPPNPRGQLATGAPEQAAQPAASEPNLLVTWLRPHSELQQSFVACLTHEPRRSDMAEHAAAVVDFLLGQRRRCIGGALALEAAVLGIHQKSLPDYIWEAQAATYVAVTLSVESLCDYVSGRIADGSCSPVAARWMV